MTKEKKKKPEFDAKSAKPQTPEEVERERIYRENVDIGEQDRKNSADAWARRAEPNKYWPMML